jgi:hypothetical protein
VVHKFLVRADTEWATLLGLRLFFEGDGPLMPLEVERRAG